MSDEVSSAGRRVTSLCVAMVTTAIVLVGCTNTSEPSPGHSPAAETTTVGPPIAINPTPTPTGSPEPEVDLIDWVEFMTPTEVRTEIQVLEPSRALYIELLESGATNLVVGRQDGSRDEILIDKALIVQTADFSSSGVIYSTTDAAEESGLRIWRWEPGTQKSKVLWSAADGWDADDIVHQDDAVYIMRLKGERTCLSTIDVSSISSSNEVTDVTCTDEPARPWWLIASQDGSLSYLVSEVADPETCAPMYRLSPTEEIAAVTQVPCASRGWADGTYAAWTDPPAASENGPKWSALELHAHDGKVQIDLGQTSGSALRCGDRLAWRTVGPETRDELRVWDPARGITVAYLTPMHAGSYTEIIGGITCADGVLGFLTFDGGTNKSTYYTERSLGWTLDGP